VDDGARGVMNRVTSSARPAGAGYGACVVVVGVPNLIALLLVSSHAAWLLADRRRTRDGGFGPGRSLSRWPW
jgi:hypothetical protein